MTDSSTAELQAHAEALTTRVLDGLYADPLWDARYGERGRKFAHEDMVAAIEADQSSSQTLRTGTRALFHATTAKPAP